MTDISNTADLINSRDIIARIWDLKAEWSVNTDGDSPDDYVLSEDDWSVGLGTDGAREIVALLELQDQGRGFDDWEHGNTLISIDFFEEYIKEYVQEIGLLPDNMPEWLFNNIDWAGVADDLAVDYSQIDYDGNSYWIR